MGRKRSIDRELAKTVAKSLVEALIRLREHQELNSQPEMLFEVLAKLCTAAGAPHTSAENIRVQ